MELRGIAPLAKRPEAHACRDAARRQIGHACMKRKARNPRLAAGPRARSPALRGADLLPKRNLKPPAWAGPPPSPPRSLSSPSPAPIHLPRLLSSCIVLLPTLPLSPRDSRVRSLHLHMPDRSHHASLSYTVCTPYYT